MKAMYEKKQVEHNVALSYQLGIESEGRRMKSWDERTLEQKVNSKKPEPPSEEEKEYEKHREAVADKEILQRIHRLERVKKGIAARYASAKGAIDRLEGTTLPRNDPR